MEWQVAHHQMLEMKIKVIPLLLRDISGAIFDDTLEHIIQTVTYIKYPEETSDKSLKEFWHKMKEALPKLNQNTLDRNNHFPNAVDEVVLPVQVHGIDDQQVHGIDDQQVHGIDNQQVHDIDNQYQTVNNFDHNITVNENITRTNDTAGNRTEEANIGYNVLNIEDEEDDIRTEEANISYNILNIEDEDGDFNDNERAQNTIIMNIDTFLAETYM